METTDANTPQPTPTDNQTQSPPLVTPNADPNLNGLVEQVEKDLLEEITKNIETNQLNEEQAQKLAQHFLSLLPIGDKQELLDKLKTLGQESVEARRVYNKYISSFEEEKRQNVLSQMRDHIQNGKLDEAINVAKAHYG